MWPNGRPAWPSPGQERRRTRACPRAHARGDRGRPVSVIGRPLAAWLLPEPGRPLAPGAADGQQGPGRWLLLQPPRDRRAERGGHLQFPGQEWLSRVWRRTREHLADEIMHACALT